MATISNKKKSKLMQLLIVNIKYMKLGEQLRYQTITRNINLFVNCWSFMEIAVYPHKSACGHTIYS